MNSLLSLLARGEEGWYSESIGGKKETGTFHFRSRLPLREYLYVVGLLTVTLLVALTQAGTAIMLAPLLILGGLVLRFRQFLVLSVASVAAISYMAAKSGLHPGDVFAFVVVAFVSLRLAHPRMIIGIRGLKGSVMLTELHSRLSRNRLPKAPKGWGHKSMVRQSNGTLTGRDFIVFHRSKDTLDVALGAVSGQGVQAAMSAITLSGAFDGLLSSVSPEDFMSACNSYVYRNERQEGFVSAVRLHVNLTTGEYMVVCAGNPSPVKLNSATGTWKSSTAKGIALGVVKDTEYAVDKGVLSSGEVIMLFTDGLTPGRDVEERTDHLLGEADCLLRLGLSSGATRLMRTLAKSSEDDGALFLAWRA